MSKVLENLIPTVKTKEPKSTKDLLKSETKGDVKTTPSLFDSLLKGGIKDSKQTKENIVQKDINPSANINNTKEQKDALQTYKNTISNVSNKDIVKQKIEKINVTTNNKNENIKTVSLMDSLINDAKKDISKQVTNLDNATKNDKKILNQDDENSSKNDQILKTKSSSTSNDSIDIRETQTIKNKLQQDAKSSDNSKIKENVTQNLKSETKQNKVDNKQSTQKIKTIQEEIPKLDNKEDSLKVDILKTKILKDDTTKDDTYKTDLKQSNNLVDKKTDILSSKDTKSEIKKTENKIHTKTTENNDELINKVQHIENKIDNSDVIEKVQNSVEVKTTTKTVLNDKQTNQDNFDKNIKTKDDIKEVVQKDILVQVDDEQVEKLDNLSQKQIKNSDEKTIIKNKNQDDLFKDIPSEQYDKEILINNIKKDDITPIKNRKKDSSGDNQVSILDKLVDNVPQDSNIKNIKAVTQPQSVNNNVIIDEVNVNNSKEQLFENIYIGTQKHSKDLASLKQRQEGMKQAIEATTLKDIEKSATTLELNPGEAKVVTAKDDKKITTKQTNSNSAVISKNDKILDRLAFTQNILNEDLNIIDDEIITQAKTATKQTEAKIVSNNQTNSVDITVSAQATYTIQNKIIGAKQQMSQMMSDIARQMVENYKPPVTSFKINLNPDGLGNISVLMKTNKENGLSISLNMSNSNTKDALVDNQTILRSALARNFETTTQFTLEFGMQNNQNDQSQSGFNQQSSQNNSSSQSQQNQNDELNSAEIEENIKSDYM